MSARFIFKLDGVTVTEPREWQSLQSLIKRDNESKNLLITQESVLSFIDDGYEYLSAVWAEFGWCKTVSLTILETCNNDGNYTTLCNGLIFLSDVEWQFETKTAKVKVQDDSFYSRINNNKSLKMLPFVGKSKNGLEIDAAPQTVIDLFLPSSGVYYGANCIGYKPYDLLQFMIQFMTDDKLQFSSSVFEPGGEYADYLITSGISIRMAPASGVTQLEFESNFPLIDFKTILDNLCKIFNLGYWIESGPVLRVEKQSYFYDNTVAVTVEGVKSIIRKTDVKRLYSSVKFGSGQVLDDLSMSFPELISFLGFNTEEFILQGECNIDNMLDLSHSFITSSNIIETVIVNDDDSYDSDLFIIAFDSADADKAIQSNWIMPSATLPVFYNESLSNENIASRYEGHLASSIATYLSDISHLFLAEKNSQQNIAAAGLVVTEPITFSNDSALPGNDASDVWDTAVHEFMASLGGIYTIDLSLIINDLAVIAQTIDVHHKIYDNGGLSGGVLIDTITWSPVINNGIQTLTNSANIYIAAGNKLLVSVEVNGVYAFSIDAGSTISCTAENNGNNIVKEYNSDEATMLLYEFEYPLSKKQIDILKANPNQKIQFSDNCNSFNAWIEMITINEVTGMCKFNLTGIRK